MESSARVIFEVKKESNVYRFDCPNGASLGEAYDVLNSFTKHLVAIIQQHAEKAKSQEVPKEEEPCKADLHSGCC